MSESDQLPIPETAKMDARSLEVLRVWIAENDQHVALRSGTWNDPAAWGIMLSDLMHHIADSYSDSSGWEHAAVLARIKEGFNAEQESPTDRPTGEFI